MTKISKIKKASAKTITPPPGVFVSPEINGVRTFVTSAPVEDLLYLYERNTHQRNETIRSLKHLEVLQPEHLLVHVLQGLCGKLVLIDGHSRRLKWLFNNRLRPKHIEVRIYDIVDAAVDFDAEELRLYNSHDSRRAVKTSAHTVQGALNALNIELKTPWLQAGNFAEALKWASNYVHGAPSFKDDGIGPVIDFFSEALIEFDNLIPSRKKFCASFIAAAVLLLHSKTNLEKTKLMLRKYSDNERGFSHGELASSFSHLSGYRDRGFDGAGVPNASAGYFPTSRKAMDLVGPQILAYMVKCRDHENKTFRFGDKEIAPLSRADIYAL